MMRRLTVVTILLVLVFSVIETQAQNVVLPPHACGLITSLSVAHDRVDNGGYAPRLKEGSQAQFDCIVSRDTNFTSVRFSSAVRSHNYWLGLLSAELGLPLGLLPE